MSLLLVVAVPVAAYAATVTLSLSSSKDGQTVGSGTAVDWQIDVLVSSGDNAGLALVAVDLVQDPNNAELFDIPPGTAVPAGMTDFSRPNGISNPGEGGATTGFIGVQRGTAGAMNLIQIGGGQNTFGQAGSTIGTDANVDGGVGQGTAAEVMSGTFNAPATEGTYTFSLENGIANVLDSVSTPPAFSPVSAATVMYSPASFTFTVGSPCICGDANGDGVVNTGDIDCFVYCVVNPGMECPTATNPACSIEGSDTSGDGNVNTGDIDSFVYAVVNGGCP